MNEKWAVAFEPDETRRDRFTWARTPDGEIAVFERQLDARKWVLSCRDGIRDKAGVVYVKISSK